MVDYPKPTFAGLFWKIFLLLRWIHTILILILLRDYFALQILSLWLSSLFFQALQVSTDPLSCRLEHTLTLFNELMVTVYLYLLLCLTDFTPEVRGFRDLIGWGLTGMVIFTVGVNTVKAVVMDVRGAWRAAVRKY